MWIITLLLMIFCLNIGYLLGRLDKKLSLLITHIYTNTKNKLFKTKLSIISTDINTNINNE